MERTIRVRNESQKDLLLIIGNSPIIISKFETLRFKINAQTGVDKTPLFLKLFDPITKIEIGEPFTVRSTVNYYLIRDNWERKDTVYITGMFFAY